MIYLILTMKALKRFVNDKFIKEIINKIWEFIIDWRTSVSFFIAWMITNGWSYCFFFIGNLLNISWMKWVGGTYLAFLWFPGTPEKLITIPLMFKIKKLLSRRKK